MKKNSMRLLGFLLAAVMMVSLLAVVAFAGDTANDVNETASQSSETLTWKDGDVIDGITISKDVTINVSGTVTVNGTIRLAPDAICNVVFNGSENAKLIRGEGFTGQMFYAEGTSANFQKLTFNNMTLDGGAVWTGDVDKTLNRGTTNSGVKATGSVLYLVYANATLENGSVLQNHDDSTGEKANAVFLRYYSTFTVNDSIVRNNNSISTYYRGGVVTIRQGGTVKTYNADVYGNSGPAGGFVGISATGAFGGIVEVKDSKFHNNYSDNGAVFLMQCNSKIGYLSIEGCEFYENASKSAVLTEWAYSRPFIIKDSYFHDNECAVWDCNADPVLDLSGKIVVEEDADYTKYLFETPLVLGGALTDGASIAISEASLTKLLSTKAYVVTGTADYAITDTDLDKFVLPEGYKFLVADVNFDGIMDAVPVDVDFVVSQVTVTLKDSLDADASETRTVIAGLAYDYGTPSAHTGFTFTGWQKDDGKAVNAPIAVTSDSILIAQRKLANPSVAVSVNGATLTATVSNANEDIAYTYQWYIDGTAIDGATADTYTMTDLASHKYRCAVTASYEGYKSTSGKKEVTASVPAAAQIGDVKYETLAEAIAAANAADGATTVTLLADVTLSEKLTITGDVTIEGAYTITRGDDYTGTLFTVNAGATLTLDGGLTIDGGNNWAYTVFPPVMDLENGSGTKVADHITPAEGGVNATAHMIVNNGTLNVLSVTIENNYSTSGISLINAGANSVTILDGATIRHTAANRSGAVANIGGIDAILTIKGTTRITDNFGVGNGGIIQNYGQGTTVNLEGGSIDNNFVGSSGTLYASYSSNASKINTFNMTGGIITENVMEGYGPVYIHTNTVWNMSGGEISENVSYLPSYVRNNNPAGSMTGGKIVNNEITGLDYSGGYYLTHPDLRLNGKTAITGGIYSQNVFEYIAPNTGVAYDDGLYTVVSTGLYKLHLTDPVTGEPATIPYLEGNVLASLVATGKLFYADYYEMTLEVLYDVKVDETVVIDYPMTIDLNGHTIAGFSTMQSTPVFRVVSDVTVIGEGKVDGRPGSACYAFIVGQDENAGNLTIENGIFYGDTSAISVTKGTATINGGKFAVNPYQEEGKEDNYNFLLNCIDKNYKDGTAKIVVKGGTFYKFNPAANAAEGANTSFVHEDCLVETNGDYYSVRLNKDALPTIADIVIKTEDGNTVTLKYPSERFDGIQHLIGTNDYADFVLGADQNEMLAYVANGNVTDIVMNLYDDIELDAPINFYNKYFQVPATYDITINGNNHTITWADGYNGTLINVESGVGVTLKNITINGDNAFTFHNDTTAVENDQNWYTRFVDVGEEDKAINDNVIVNAGNLKLDHVTIVNVTIASDGVNGKTENTETGYVLKYNDDLALIKSNGGSVVLDNARIFGNAGMVLNAINTETKILRSGIEGNMGAGNKGGIIIANGGTMSIKDTSIDRNKAMARSATILGVVNGAEVVFDGFSTMNNNKHIGVGSNTAGAMIVLEGASQFVMNGGSISNNIGGRAGAIASRWVGGNYGQHEDTSIVLNAGTIKGNTASNDSWNGASIFLRSPATIGEGMKIGGTIAVNAAPGALEIIGGTFTGSLTVTDGLVAEITGGTFNYDPTEWLAEGYVAIEDDGLYTVESAIAEIFFSAFGGSETSVTYPGFANSLQELVDYYMFCNNANETAIPGFSAGDYTPVLVIYGELSAEDVAYLGGASTDGAYVSAKPMTWTVRFADGVDADENVKAADGYVVLTNDDGTLTVTKILASLTFEFLGATEYYTYPGYADGDEPIRSMHDLIDVYLTHIIDRFGMYPEDPTITLHSDIALDETFLIDAQMPLGGEYDYDLTLDLNGYTITSSVTPAIRIVDDLDVTVKNGTMDTDSYCFILGASDGSSAGNLTIESGSYTGTTSVASVTKGTLTILGGEFKAAESNYGATYMLNCIDANYKDGSAKIVVKGGRFYGFNPENNAAEGASTNFVPMGYRASIYGTIDGVDVYDVVELKATVEAGDITYYFPGVENIDNVQELANYYFLMQKAMGWILGYDYEPVLTLYAELTDEVVLGNTPSDDTTVTLPDTVTWTIVTNGFNADLIKAAEDYVKIDNGDGTITIQKAVAKVGDTYFATLQDAFAACTNGETITLLVDLVYDADDVVPAHGGATGFGKYDQYNPSIIYIGGTKGATDAENQPSNVNAVLDLNGHTITNNADAYLFLFMDNCKVTIKDSKDGDGIIGNTEAPVIWVTGTDTLVTIENGKYTTANAEGLLWSTHGGDLVIKGGEFSTSADDASLLIVRNAEDRRNPNYFVDGKATVTIYGGTFYGFDPEKMMDDSTDPFTEFDACADGYKSIKNGNVYTVENYVEWIKQQLLLGNDVVLEKDIVVDGSMIESIPASTNGNGYYYNPGIFNVVGDYDVTFDLNGHTITYVGHEFAPYTAEYMKKYYYNGETGKYEVCSCTIAHGLFFANDGAHLTIVGEGDVIVNGVASGVYSTSPDTAITIQGGNWVNNGCAKCGATNLFLYASHGGELYIEGGRFEQALDSEGNSYLIVVHGGEYKNSVIDFAETKIVVTGGTFVGMDPSKAQYFQQTADNKLVTGETVDTVDIEYMVVKDGDTYTVTEWNYEIWTKADLERLSAIVNGGNTLEGVTVKLMANIDLYEVDENGNRVTFVPIANNGSFNGIFEGNDHTISNLYQSGWALGYEWSSYGAIGLFGNINGATIRNLTIADAECLVEGGDVGAIAGSAEGDCTLEGITVKNSTFATYNNGCGGLIGWAGAGHFTFKDIEVDEDTVIAGLWGSFDSSLGGILGQLDEDASAHFENVHVACRIDAYNDVTASYKWYSYRMCGMLIGRVLDVQQINGTNYPDPAAADVTIGENVVVTFGDWANYHYIWNDSLSRGCQRVEAGYEYGGIDITQYPGSTYSYIRFDALFGGPQSQRQGYYGLSEYPGVKVNIPAVAAIGETEYWTLQEALNAAKNGETVVLLKDLTYGAVDVVYPSGGATGFGNYDQYNPSIIYIGGTKGATEAENQPSNVNAVLDLNGHTITNNADAYLFLFMDNCKVTIKDSQDGDGIIGNTEAPVIWVTGTDTLVTIENGKYTTVNAKGLLWSTHGGDLVIKGGEFSTSADDASLLIVRNAQDRRNPNYFIDGKATVTIYGGTFYGFDPEKMMDDSTNPFTEFNAVAEGYRSYEVEENVWIIISADSAVKLVNKITGDVEFFDSIAAAMAEAQKTIGEDTVYLIKDHTESVVLVYDGVVLDVQNYTLTADYLVVFKGGYLTGKSYSATRASGTIKIDKNRVIIAEGCYADATSALLPIWNQATSSYVFGRYLIKNDPAGDSTLGAEVDENGNLTVDFKVQVNGSTATFMTGDTYENHGVSFRVVAEWTANGVKTIKSYVYTDEMVQECFGGNKSFRFTLAGATAIENLTVKLQVVSDTGSVVEVIQTLPESSNQ